MKNSKSTYFRSVFAGLIFCAFTAQAQFNSFRFYSIESGLNAPHVQAITQDQKGYIWLGLAEGGLSRFDGKSFQNYSIRNGLPSNDVSAVQSGNDGELWVGTDEGLCFLKNNKIESVEQSKGVSMGKVTRLSMDPEGRLWVLTGEGRIFLKSSTGKEFRSFDKKNGLPDSTFIDIVHSKGKGTWLATNAGIVRFAANGDLLKTYGKTQGLQSLQCNDLALDNKGKVWLASWGGGIAYYDEKTDRFNTIALGNGAFENIALSIAPDAEGALWIGTLGSGLFYYKNGVSKSYGSGTFQPSDFISYVFLDSRGDLWAMSSDESLYKANLSDKNKKLELRKVSAEANFPEDNVSLLFEDVEKNMWIGTYRSGLGKALSSGVVNYKDPAFVASAMVTEYDNTTYIAFEKGELWKETGKGSARQAEKQKIFLSTTDKLTSLCIAGDKLYVGTTENGVLVFSKKSLRQERKISFGNGLPNNRVQSLFADTQKNVWICTSGGIAVLKGGRVQLILRHQMLKSKSYTAMQQSSDGTLWAIGEQKGILHIDKKGQTKRYSNPYQLSGCLEWDPVFKRLLSGTEADGLLAIYPGKDSLSIRTILGSKQISNSTIKGIIKCDSIHAWLSTTNGLYKIALGSDTATVVKELAMPEGLAGIVGMRSALSCGGSSLHMGTISGLARVDLDKLTKNTRPPETVISSIHLLFNNDDIRKYSAGIDSVSGLPLKLQVPYASNHITFDFSAISHTNPDRVMYRYRLLDSGKEEWSPAGTQASVNYANMLPGSYTFEVVACNEDGVWDASPASFKFTIKSPVYLKWWFILLVLALVGFAFYTFYKWRIGSIRQTASLQQQVSESEQKALRAQMNPHFIFNSLNSIQFFITENDTKAASRYLSKFGKLMRKILDNSKTPTITLHEELEALKLYLELEAMRFEGKFVHTIEVESSVDVYSIEIPAMLMQPYMENAIWHGFKDKKDGALLTIRMSMTDDDNLYCEIEDNGIGRKKAQELKMQHPTDHQSSGMKITSARLEAVSRLRGAKGRLEIEDLYAESGEPRGTMVKMWIPV